MATKQQAPERPAPRLYLAAPTAADPAQLAARLAAALGAADIAAVLMPVSGGDERALLNSLKTLAPVVQGAGAALLIGERADLVARAGADGVHLSGIEQFSAAASTLKPERIAGCGGLATRHDAMTAAEGAADYVMFGEPNAAGHRPPFESVLERIVWWAEVFEVPCVGYAANLEEIGPLVAAGADFVAVGAFIFDDPRGPAAAIREAAARLVAPETVQ